MRLPRLAAAGAAAVLGLTTAAFAPGWCAAPPPGDADPPLALRLRSQVEIEKGKGLFRTEVRKAEWDPRKTAAVVCDMWDQHWSTNATKRVAEMAPRLNDLLTALRNQGVLIIHCPSDTLNFYKDTPQRKLARSAPPAPAKVPLQGWCKLDSAREPPLPIDDSDGGDDTIPPSRSRKAWSRQIATLEVGPDDAITDSAEAYNLMRQRGVENVLVMGVHTNMCVLGRPFGVRQLVAQGLTVALVRDLTDTMYNPKKPPFVSHFTGTDLVVDHVERYWCPSVTSDDVLGGKPFRFKGDTRARLVVVSAEEGYSTETTLPAFVRRQRLGQDFRVSYVFGDPKDRNRLPGIEVLNDADAAVFSVRRRALPEAELAAVRRFVTAGKGIVGIRTASHAFAPVKGEGPPDGRAFWPEFGPAVLGCNYTGPYPRAAGTRSRATAADHPALRGVPADEVKSAAELYKVSPLAKGAVTLMVGQSGAKAPAEPVAWAWARPDHGRTFSTTLGHADDFADPVFVRLLRNGIYWAAGREVPESAPRDRDRE